VRMRVDVLHERPVYSGGFARRCLELVAEFYGTSNVKEQVSKLLDDVGLPQASDKRINSYSVGIMQRGLHRF
jgi:ABC-type multidrug transport system ATPase subunit